MNRKSRIVVVLVAFGLVPAAASPVALAGSPLLSGYGGPGTGEQAVIGSTLIGGGGGSGSSGSAGSGGSSSANSTTAGGAGSTVPGTTSAVTGGSSAGGGGSRASSKGSGAGEGASGAKHAGGSHTGGSAAIRGTTGGRGIQVHAFVYPTALRSASVDSPALGISGSDLLLLLAAIATLALVAAATLRLSRLQRGL